MQPRISMITLGVTDLVRSVQFYEQGLSLPRKSTPADDSVAFFDLAGTWLGLFPREELAKDATTELHHTGSPSITLAHNVTTREQVDELLDEAVRAGARLVKPAQDVFWGGYSGYFADPDDYLWEIAWNPHFWVGPAATDA